MSDIKKNYYGDKYRIDFPISETHSITSITIEDIEKLKQASKKTGLSIRRLCTIFVKKGLKNVDKLTLFKDFE
ncbi:MAG: hypothetical protein ACTSPQ_22580 [Candidatus Helarchaeota archaeon]